MTDSTDMAVGAIKVFVGYVVISFSVGALLSPLFSDITPSDEVVQQCVDTAIKGVDRDTLNSSFLDMAFKACTESNTVAAATISFGVVLIAFAIAIGVFFKSVSNADRKREEKLAARKLR